MVACFRRQVLMLTLGAENLCRSQDGHPNTVTFYTALSLADAIPHAARLPGQGCLKNGGRPGNPGRPSLRSSHSERHALSIGGNAERSMPDAWRTIDRGSHA